MERTREGNGEIPSSTKSISNYYSIEMEQIHSQNRGYSVELGEQIKEVKEKQMEEKKNEDLRNTMVVVAVLILTVTYQAALSPPGGSWQDDSAGHIAGTPVLRNEEPWGLLIYCFFNKLAFFSSMLIIFMCLSNDVSRAVRICRIQFIAAVMAMVATYITGTLLIARESNGIFTVIEESFVHVLAFLLVAGVLWVTSHTIDKNVNGLSSARVHSISGSVVLSKDQNMTQI